MADETRAQLEQDYQWLPPEAIDAYLTAYFNTGDLNRAWIQLRQDPRYAEWFPGNLTDDGRPRYSEDMYANAVAQYDSVMESVGLGDTFRHRYGEWIAGDVTPKEAQARVVPMYERITSQSDQLKLWYAENYGVEMTDAALLASVLDPGIGEGILAKQISVAEIGGEALESGFDLDKEYAESLLERSADMSRDKAEALFQRAESFVPVLSTLAARHNDPDDDFDLKEFVSADLFADPTQRRRLTRLIAQESALFTGGAQIDYKRARQGGVAGLRQT